MQERLKKQERYRRLLTLGGVVVTVGYWALILNWSGRHGWHLSKLSAQDAGTFLSGAFAPVAFLWLVIGFYLQSAELKQNSESLALQALEMKNAVEQATKQAEAAGATEKYSRISVVNNLRITYENELGSLACEILGMVKKSSYDDKYGHHYIDARPGMWDEFEAGNRAVFATTLIEFLDIDGVLNTDLAERYVGGEFSNRACQRYTILFEDYANKLQELGEEKLIEGVSLGPYEHAYSLLKNLMAWYSDNVLAQSREVESEG